eukprot:4537263-Lingulodinium_polyedra.AAC.2
MFCDKQRVTARPPVARGRRFSARWGCLDTGEVPFATDQGKFGCARPPTVRGMFLGIGRRGIAPS